jgi:DNA polymerase III epsilon subunit family exonuclease
VKWTVSWLRWREWRVTRPEDRRPLVTLLERFVAIDVETTGLDPRRDAIVSVAVVPFEGGVPAGGCDTLVNPGRPIPPASTRIHGITDAMVRDSPRVDQVLDEIDALCGDHVIVGHGVAFDLVVLERARHAQHRPRLPNTSLCTKRLAAALNPGWDDVTLEALAARLGVPVVGRHTARGDAVTAGAIMLGLLPELARRGFRTVADAAWFQSGALR